MSKMVKTKEQIQAIMRMMDYCTKKRKKRFPKIMIDRTSLDSYRVIGYKELGGGEEIVNVCDSTGMDSTFLMDNIIGEVGNFLRISENTMERIFYRYRYN